MSQQLPLQLRKDIRDIFDNETSPVRECLSKLFELVGYPVACHPEWHMLWTELESSYPDKTTFIPDVAKVVEVWSDTLARRLDDDKYEAWTELFLEHVKSVISVNVLIQVADLKRVQTTWTERKNAFIISLPKKSPLKAWEAASAFAGDFEDIFRKPAAPSTDIQQRPQQQPAPIQDDEEWSDVISNADTKSLQIRNNHPSEYSPPLNEDLPSVQNLPRPEILFQSTTPYIMQVISSGAGKITINGTHEPSLRLLSEYLQRWMKTDPQDVRKVPYLRIKLQESKFGLGLLYDSLIIEPFDHLQRNVVVNPSLILVFIQGILGYQAVSESQGGGYWEFKRHRAFGAP